jgi:hypothetical protein
MAEPKKTGSLAVGEPSAAPLPPSCDWLDSETDAGFWSPPKSVVNVIFTTSQGTQVALWAASQWARCLVARIVPWSFQMAPRQCPADDPPTSATFKEQHLQSLGAHCEDLEIVIRVCLSSDLEQCLLNVLEPDSVVVMVGRKCWPPTRDQKLATLLHPRGYRVLFIPTKEDVPATVTTPKRIPI